MRAVKVASTVRPSKIKSHREIMRKCDNCKKKEKKNFLQRRAVREGPEMQVPPIVHEVLRSPGQPLDRETREFMETRFAHDFSKMQLNAKPTIQSSLIIDRPGNRYEQEADRVAQNVLKAPKYDAPRKARYDFSLVRIHSDAQSTEAARAVNALAFTVGRSIVFGSGMYKPGNAEGRGLLAHELAHVVQQGQGNQENHIQRACGPTNIAVTVGTHGTCIDRFDGTFISGPSFKFNVNCDTFLPGQKTALSGFVGGLAPASTLEVHGYASVDGPLSFNQDLGCARALAARKFLTDLPPSGAGFSSSRIAGVINHGPVPGPAIDRRAIVIRTTTPRPIPTVPPSPPTPGCISPTNPDRSGRAFNPTTAGETRICVTNPIDCHSAFSCSDTAFAAAGASGLDGPHLGPQDAFRHCVWSCCMAQEMGASEAEKFGTAHENSNPSPIPFDDQMDLHNNATGRILGAPSANCETVCETALTSGRLRTIRGPHTRPPAMPPVPTACIGASNQPWP